MKIILSDKLKDYLKNKNISYVTVHHIELKHSDFNPTIPTVMTGKPKKLDKFQSIVINNTTFYIDKVLYRDTNVLNLKVRSFLFMKEIYVDDWDLTM